MKITDIRRMWVNQPSTIQPYHKLNGTNVLAVVDKSSATIFFLTGPIVSQEISPLALSEGWIKKNKTERKFHVKC